MAAINRNKLGQFLTVHKYLLPYWGKLVLIFLCALGFLSFGIFMPYLSRIIIDFGILKSDVLVLKTMLGCSVILYLFSTLIGIIQKYLSFYTTLHIGFKLRMDFYRILCKKPLDYFEDKPTGELLYRITTDTNGVINLITGTIPTVLLTIVRLALICLISMWLNWQVTLVVFSIMPLYYFLNHYFGKKQYHVNKALNEKGQMISYKLQDQLSHIQLYKAFYKERDALNSYKKAAIEQIRILIKNFWLGIGNEQSNTFLNTGFSLLLTFYLGLMVINGKITLGSSMALSIYIYQLASILKSIGGIYQNIISQFIYIDRFFQVYDQTFSEPSRKEPTNLVPLKQTTGKRENAVVFSHVSFGYRSGGPIITDLNMAIESGKTTAIIGNSGIGKSTMAKLMLRLYVPTCGRIYINGNELNALSDRVIRKEIAIVMQQVPLLNDTLMANLTFGKFDVHPSVIDDVIKITEIDSFAAVHNNPAFIGENGIKLSLGQQQRIAIAMALIRDPSILILDEATNQIDSEMEKRILDNIRDYKPEITLIIISCRRSLLNRVDRVIEMKNAGAIKELGIYSNGRTRITTQSSC